MSVNMNELQEMLKGGLKKGGDGLQTLMKMQSLDEQPTLNLSKEIAPYKRLGWLIIASFVGILVVWGMLAPLEGAAVAPGKIVVSGNRKKVQHLEGGIIAAIHVKEGQTVKAGQPLLDLLDTQAKSRHLTVEHNLVATYARVTRLLAERDNKAKLVFNWPKVSEEVAKKIPELRQQQLDIISSRRNEVTLQRRTISQQIQKLNNDLDGYRKQYTNLQSQLKLVQDRLNIAEKLKQDKLFSQDQYLTLKMQETDQHSQMQQTETQIKNIEGEIKSKQIEYENVVNLYQKNVLEELQQATEDLEKLKEQTKEQGDVLGRTQIVAPQSGIVTGLKVVNIGQVISPGEVLMEIVPQDDALIIEARVRLQDIDDVRVGQEAKIILVPYRTRYMPTIMAKVDSVSPDTFRDDATGENYYVARLTIEKSYLEGLDNVQLYPGMPTEVFLLTQSRSMFNYLIDPLRQSFRHAMRED